MPNYKHDRLSGNLINLTNEAIYLYEVVSGEIWTFPPSDAPLPESPYFDPDLPTTHYVVEPETAKELRRSYRSLDDIAILTGKSIGRHHAEIAQLTWGTNPSVKVVLYKDFKREAYKQDNS